MRGDLVIGIDSSTTATKAIAWDRRGRAVAEGRAAIPLSNPRPGWFEQKAEDWTKALTASLRQLARKIDMTRVAALAISNQRESFAQFDRNDRALRPGTLWLDERAPAEARELAAKIGAERIRAISGKPSDVTPCISRCAWFARHMPGLWKKTAMTAEVHGVLTHFLTGHWHTSTASADPMGLIDMARYDWSDELISAVGLTRDQLPKLFRPGDVMGEVTAAAAKATGLKPGTPVIAGGGDGQCAGTGTNIFVTGRAYVNIGTACVSGSAGSRYAHAQAFRTLTTVAEDGYIYETCLRTGTFLINWTVETLFNAKGSPALFKTLEAEAAAAPVGANGIVVMPHWSGSMTPFWDSTTRGVIAGLSASHRRGDVYRAVLEGIALEQAMMTNLAAAASQPIDHYVAIGGGAKSDLLCQILADASGRAVKRLATVEASSLGAAVAAAKGAGWFKSIPQAAAAMAGKPVRTFRPSAKSQRRYQELLAIYTDLYPAIRDWNARLDAFAAKDRA
jgi:xylulokinase